MLPWWSHLFGGGEMWTLALREGGRLVGLAPLFLHGTAVRQVSFIGSGVTDYLGFLVDDEFAAEGARVFCEHVSRCASRWDFCDFQEVEPEAALATAAFGSGLHAERSVSTVCPMVRLPASLQELEARLSPKFRHNLRNSARRLRDLGVTFETASPGEDGEYVEALFRLHAARWNGRGEAGVLATAPLQCFLRAVAAGFRARGWVRLHGLRYRGELHGVAAVFSAHRRSAYYLGGFEGELSRYSPGQTLIRFAMEQAIAEGAEAFDFLRNGEAYKYRWGAQDRVNVRIVVRKEAGRKVLP